MKKILIAGFAVAMLASCKKDKTACYECDLEGNGTYVDQGCYTKEDWDQRQITDIFGNNIDKNTRCRKK